MFILGGVAYEQQVSTDQEHLEETGTTMAPRTRDSLISWWKLKPHCLVYLLLALSYLLIIILFGIVISNVFPCGSRSREWEYFHGGCYFFSVQDATWHTAKDHCEEKNSTLVVIHDLPKQNFLQSRTRGHRHWIGLTDENNEGQWRWIDGTSYRTSFKNWKTGEPNNYDRGEDCALMDGPGIWNDMSCNSKAFYVCEKPLPS
ncbi:hepatic lectin-like isoform X2 [Sceloporus undulatus]|uniref:hepatic lectin-like isoform X2 n=1 Tax=Sceloporus undulatus TaxID=8520 RepID=UPI001C4D3C95|nr:hepatic lectin-like isoform X2 [Sceloporus undulatus]